MMHCSCPHSTLFTWLHNNTTSHWIKIVPPKQRTQKVQNNAIFFGVKCIVDPNWSKQPTHSSMLTWPYAIAKVISRQTTKKNSPENALLKSAQCIVDINSTKHLNPNSEISRELHFGGDDWSNSKTEINKNTRPFNFGEQLVWLMSRKTN